MNIEFAPAFILHQRPYRESSLLLDVLSRDYGRVRLVAKGVRKTKRSQQGLYQLYQPLLISWLSGRSDLYSLIAIESDTAPYTLKGHASLCGLYVNELLVKLLPFNETEPEIFAAYLDVIACLQQSKDIELNLRLFEKRVLSSLGYGLVLDYLADSSNEIIAEESYFYKPDSGLFAWEEGVAYPKISGRSLKNLQAESGLKDEDLKEIKLLMRSVIHFYLGAKPLVSRQLFSQQYKIKS